MPKQHRNSRMATADSKLNDNPFLDMPPIFEPLENRRLLATIGFENLSVGNLGSGGYTDSAGYKFVNLPGSGGTSQGDLYVYGSAQGYSSKVLHTHNWGRKIVVNRPDGAGFDLASFNYAEGRWGESGDATVTGYFKDGTTKKTSYSFSSKSLKTLTLNWTGLSKVEVNFSGGSNDAYGAVDGFVLTTGGGSSGGTTYQEQGGRVDIEAEKFSGSGGSTSKGDWKTNTSASAGGGVNLEASPNSGNNWGDSTSGARRDYSINFSSTGTYYVWARMRATSGNDDSIHVGLNGTLRTGGSMGMTLKSGLFDGAWHWTGTEADGSRVTVNVGSTGAHKLNLWMREDGAKVDQFILTKDANFKPGDSGGDSGGGDSGGDSGGGGSGDPNATQPVARITAATSLNIMAGMSVHVNALSSAWGVGDMDTARFEWDFGDPNGQRNKVIGWNAGHLYENPGTYTIKLKLWNQAQGYDESTVTVNVASNTRKKIYVSPSGNNSNSGTSSGSPVKTIVRAVELMRANNGNAEILLQRGARHDLASPQSIDRPNVLIGAYGSGSNPLVNWTRGRYDTKSFFLLGYGTQNITVRDLVFDTPYHNDTDGTNMPHALQPAGKNVTIYNNEFRHVGDAVAGNAVPTGVLVLKNHVPSDVMLRRYFAWIEGSDWTIMDNSAPNSTREHIVRSGDGARMNISHNTFTNLDRRGKGDSADTAKGVVNVQKGSYAYVAHNTLRGPSSVGPLGKGDGTDDTSARFRHAVFEGNRILGQFQVVHGAEDIEIRNNIMESNSAYEHLILSVEGYNSTYNRTVKNLSIVNNTGINHQTSGQFIHVWGPTSSAVISNNLYYAPQLYAGPYAAAIVHVDASNLNGFSRIDNNVWADADWMDWAGGLMWVGTGTGNTGFKDKSEWLAYSQVSDDKFSDVSIDGSYRPSSSSVAASAGDRAAGVLVDYYGSWRPNKDGRAVGAVHV